MSLFEELKRRNVIRVSVAYIVAAWLILQFSDILLDNMEAPDWVFQVILLLLGIGLVLTVFFAWAFELTPDGVMRAEDVDLTESITPNTGRKLNAVTIVLLVVAVVVLLWDKFDGSDIVVNEQSLVAKEVEKSIAVLPLRTLSSNEEDTYFADGIHDDLLTQLSKLSSLDKVISRTSTERYRDTTLSMQAIGSELGVATILEGGVQRAGTHVRINSAKGRRKDRNIRREPRVSLSLCDPDNPYRYLEVRGRVVDISEEGADAHIDPLAH